uniref:Glycosyl transferase family 1 n=1 Tax=Marinobacter nauticus TaxID=2743 RepID=A0A455WCC1_MARNT|nr:glycosyl transferase family 1 [Marinobacter nauticus]
MRIVLLGTTVACVIGFRGELIKDLVARGHEVYAFALDYNQESSSRVAKLGAVPVNYAFSRAGLNPIGDFLNTLRLKRQLKRLGPDVVLTYFAKPVIFGTIAARLAGIRRVVGMLEGLGYVFTDDPAGESLKDRLLRHVQVSLYRLSLPLLERLIFLNRDDPKDLVERHGLRVKESTVLGGIGLDLDRFNYSVPEINPVTFLFVGRLLKEKGINEYVEAARLTKERFPETRFLVLGGLDEENPGGLSKKELMLLVERNVVEYPGYVEDVPEWIRQASVFVLPSYREGLPRSTQEAMAMGRAVITTDVPGCRETVENHDNGILVPAGDVQSLADAMAHFIENPDLVVSMGREGRRIAEERYDVRYVNSSLIAFLEGPQSVGALKNSV